MRRLPLLLTLAALTGLSRESLAYDACTVTAPNATRQVLGLTVHDPPRRPQWENHLRLRSHSDGSLSQGDGRTWIGPPVPSFVPLTHQGAELVLLEHDKGEVVGLYREMYGGSSCQLGSSDNCDYFALGFDGCGKPLFALALNRFMSRSEHLEVQDLRYADGTLYFNEACQSYSRQAMGRCSALVAVDAKRAKLRWRSHNLVSNHRLVVHGDYVITGYGFTGETHRLHVVRRRDGRVVHSVPLTSPQIGLSATKGELEVVLTIGWQRQYYALERWPTQSPGLRLLRTTDRPQPPPARRSAPSRQLRTKPRSAGLFDRR